MRNISAHPIARRLNLAQEYAAMRARH
jgi:hypothetical protein